MADAIAALGGHPSVEGGRVEYDAATGLLWVTAPYLPVPRQVTPAEVQQLAAQGLVTQWAPGWDAWVAQQAAAPAGFPQPAAAPAVPAAAPPKRGMSQGVKVALGCGLALMLGVCGIGLLMSIVIPVFNSAVEKSRSDAASATDKVSDVGNPLGRRGILDRDLPVWAADKRTADISSTDPEDMLARVFIVERWGEDGMVGNDGIDAMVGEGMQYDVPDGGASFVMTQDYWARHGAKLEDMVTEFGSAPIVTGEPTKAEMSTLIVIGYGLRTIIGDSYSYPDPDLEWAPEALYKPETGKGSSATMADGRRMVMYPAGKDKKGKSRTGMVFFDKAGKVEAAILF